MRRGLWRSLFPFAVLAIAGAVAVLLQPAPELMGGRARVSDGDSFRLGSERIRLVGLDAPELGQTCTRRDGEAWPCGDTARNRMAQLLNSGNLTCETTGRDQFDRYLATCSVDGRDLGSVMVEEGLALNEGGYAAEERRARDAGRGMWKGEFESPRAWRRSGGDSIDWVESLRNWLLTLIGAT
ncbi:thermonuclease family protein [Arsenicitalea aurantiaca]|uniref:Thermonuclease family protein n=1 Tax=Arsenicitalea aurantiaca TaxID=1783274 RepID=A0A433XA87_9HYPH|nr:thermonuclease family protein [Arsenicitalea aurantiaca]RUT30950.1 thermonuclease family protein [Arsenicitalea aurantiaca]